MKALRGRDWLADRMSQIRQPGKAGLDRLLVERGRLLAETILDLDRVEQAGPAYRPKAPGWHKWEAQLGSVCSGDQNVPVMRPRLRRPVGEILRALY
ncbi:hypothetical protein [Nitrospira sp. Kam-Ns4a]